MNTASLFRRTAVATSGLARASLARPFSTTSPREIARITIVGNLGDAPELQTTSSGRELVRYVVASNSGPRENRQTSWFRVAAFKDGPQRDYLLNLTKGSQIYLEGDVSISTYVDTEGVTKSSLNVVQRNLELLKRKDAGEGGEHSQQ